MLASLFWTIHEKTPLFQLSRLAKSTNWQRSTRSDRFFSSDWVESGMNLTHNVRIWSLRHVLRNSALSLSCLPGLKTNGVEAAFKSIFELSKHPCWLPSITRDKVRGGGTLLLFDACPFEKFASFSALLSTVVFLNDYFKILLCRFPFASRFSWMKWFSTLVQSRDFQYWCAFPCSLDCRGRCGQVNHPVYITPCETNYFLFCDKFTIVVWYGQSHQ